MQRLRQLEPSWFRKGHTTSLLESVMEKDDVREDLGGIVNELEIGHSSEPHHALVEVEAGVREIMIVIAVILLTISGLRLIAASNC